MENLVINRGNPRRVEIAVLGANGVQVELSRCTEVELILWVNGRSKRAQIVQTLNDILIAELSASELDYLGEYSAQVKFAFADGEKYATERVYLFRVANEFFRTASGMSENQSMTINISAPLVTYDRQAVEDMINATQDAIESTANANNAAMNAEAKAILAQNNANLANAAATTANSSAVNADAKAALAVTATTNANTATSNANTATTNANNAATNANAKAVIAQQAADSAKAQGDYAKAQGDYAKAQAQGIDAKIATKANQSDLVQLEQEWNRQIYTDFIIGIRVTPTGDIASAGQKTVKNIPVVPGAQVFRDKGNFVAVIIYDKYGRITRSITETSLMITIAEFECLISVTVYDVATQITVINNDIRGLSDQGISNTNAKIYTMGMGLKEISSTNLLPIKSGNVGYWNGSSYNNNSFFRWYAIPVKRGDVLYTNSVGVLSLWDNGEYIGNASKGEGGAITISSDCNELRLHFEWKNLSTAYVSKDSQAQYTRNVGQNEINNAVFDEIYLHERSIVNAENIIGTNYDCRGGLNWNTGEVDPNVDGWSTDYIPCKMCVNYTTNYNGNIFFYDKNRVKIGNFTTSNIDRTFCPPPEARYIRMSLWGAFKKTAALSEGNVCNYASPRVDIRQKDEIALKRSTEQSLLYHNPAANGVGILDITSPYNGSKQHTHPSILWIKNGFAGYRYWIATTPYEYESEPLENPCVYKGHDLFNMKPVTGATPLVEPDFVGHYSDVHLCFANNTLYCFYRKSSGNAEQICVQYTTDGNVWSNQEVVVESVNAATMTFLLSPVIRFINNKFCLWVANQHSKKIDYYESDNYKGFSKIRSMPTPADTPVWHMDINLTKRGYEIYYNDGYQQSNIYHAISVDNLTFSAPTRVIVGRVGDIDNYLYRPSFVDTDRSRIVLFGQFYYNPDVQKKIWTISGSYASLDDPTELTGIDFDSFNRNKMIR